jgi:tetratricopeptide (TPR) repeat protein
MAETSSGRNPVEALAEEFLGRVRGGERPALTEYTDRYPDMADAIRDLFPALLMLEDIRPATVAGSQAGGTPAPAGGSRLERLGDYRILREVGRGGMGIVYEAEQESLGRHVALKVLPAHSLLDPRQLQRFQREARAAARLHHTNIVPVFGVGEDDSLHYYVMQFINGQGLDQVLGVLQQLALPPASTLPGPAPEGGPAAGAGPGNASALAVARSLRTGVFAAPAGTGSGEADPGDEPEAATPAPSGGVRLPGQAEDVPLAGSGQPYWRSVARVGIQVAEALAYAHQQGVLHRDIKPSNLLLDTQGVVWVTDFGLAKASDSQDLTHTGDIVGTLRYLAPERFQGRADGQSDVYALGLTLYELLTLRPAFDESERNKLLHQVMHVEPPPPRRLNPAVPRDLETIVLKATARDPAHRYGDAAGLADDLQRFLDDRPIRARRVSEMEKLWRWGRRNPALALALAAVVLLTVGAFIWINHEKNVARELAGDNARLAGEEREAREKEHAARLETEAALTRETEAFKARDAAARRAQAVNDYLIRDMIAQADPHRNKGRTLTVREVLDRAAANVGRQFAGEPDLEEAIRDALAWAYLGVGQPREAVVQLTAQVELCRRLHGEHAPTTLAVRGQRVYGLLQAGDYAAVVAESTALLPLLRRVRGADDQHTLQVLENTARAHRGLGQFVRSRQLQEEVVAARRRVLGPEHVLTLESLGDLAGLLVWAGRADEAFRLCEDQLAVCRRVLGPEHGTTLTLRNQRALCLTAQGRLAEAETECRALRPLLRGTAGPDNVETLSVISNLAGVLLLRQRPAEACPLYEEYLPALRRRLGENHPEVLRGTCLYLSCLGSVGRLAEAEAVYDRLQPAQWAGLASSDPAVLFALIQYGMVLLKQAKFARAEPVWRKVVAGRRQTLPAGHWLVGEAEALLGASLLGQGRFAEAEKLLLAAHATLAGARDPPAPAGQASMAALYLSILYDKWGKPGQAAAWRARLGALRGP